MFRTVYGKLLGVLLAFGLVTALLFLMVLRTLDNAYYFELTQKVNRMLARQLVTENTALAEAQIDTRQLQGIVDQLALSRPDIDVYLLDAKGRIMLASGRPDKLQRRQIDTLPIQNFLASSDLPIMGDDPDNALVRTIFSVAPISTSNTLNGYLYIILRGGEHRTVIEQLKTSSALREATLMTCAGVLLAMMLASAAIYLITSRLRKISHAMDCFSIEDFTTQQRLLPVSSSGDELNRLAFTFNKMMERILAQLRELAQTDTGRRELLANISHDLRTPLASLQGYIETLLLKEDSLSAQDKRSYLEIAQKQCERLGRLVTKLFELAKLDSGGLKLQPEPFLLSELIQDVMQKFELAAKRKEVRLETQFPEGLPLAFADIGMIERVLENLIENALRHTAATGSIVIALLPAQHKHIMVSVADTGSGINSEDLPKIFDRFYRFYRGDKSAQYASENTGLGLAISKRILELHNSSITVESKVGVGSTFYFTLPTAN